MVETIVKTGDRSSQITGHLLSFAHNSTFQLNAGAAGFLKNSFTMHDLAGKIKAALSCNPNW
jgi:hypothetical protein